MTDDHRPTALAPFVNEPELELRRAAVRAQLEDALRVLDARLPLRVPVIVAGEAGATEGITSIDPSRTSRVVATAGRASAADVDTAVRTATAAFATWSRVPAHERASCLVRAARWMRERRLTLAALMVRECAKPWPEADADACEAIDFLEYYARQALQLDRGQELLQVPGERNRMFYSARGVAAIVSPWNFPIAIPTGMTAAALAMGNAAILKPAEQSPGCALMIYEALRSGGVPADAIALLPGEGDTGAALVAHPGVHVIAFTGSVAAGLQIIRSAAEPREGQHHVKRVVAEMGGKNTIIVDSDADLDDAVPEIVASAFGYAGQKCSAAGRVLVHEAVAGQLLERLAGAVRTLSVGPAEDLETDVPAVIDEEARDRVRDFAAIAERDGRVVARADAVPDGGWYCAPTVATDLPEGSRVVREEIFGPVLPVTAVASIRAAAEVVERMPYALTGGLFTRNPRVIDEIGRLTPVGNLYVNRGSTGAKVGRQPFGGSKLSGTGPKAGGPDYLTAFGDAHVITENTVRHGLMIE